MRPMTVVLMSACLAACAGTHVAAPPPKAAAAAPVDPIALSQAANVAVVWDVTAPDGTSGQIMASGVAINARAVLTSAPSLKDGMKIMGVHLVSMKNGEPKQIKASPLASNPKVDAIVLQSEEPLLGSAVLKTSVPKAGDRIYTVDTQPGGKSYLTGLVHSGVISHVDGSSSGVRQMMVDVSSLSMSSLGSGVYDPDGNLVAIIVMPIMAGQNISTRAVAVSAGDIVGFLRASDVSMQVKSN